ncbi:gamma-glutamyltransferase family protein [Pseudooceanicola sp.]|uniref:gamma-glutamyltransferase family protein n=1 Tax=Pseudooceanicola sp. TaxID=1914328 RepID=UPI00262B8F63|nr:gamma-glutamyltransferase family protein [Pseudooceanicola sp.]MDF1854588.1 gamma-glutamyltransferase family protein [Pseudooceanicola sp.]
MRDFHLPGRSPVLATNGICATSHPLAAREAVAVLERGGNAMDAAIAGAVLLGLCEPAMTGLGGDLFALIETAPGAGVQALNASGRAAAAADPQVLRDAGHATVPLSSPWAVTIPGAVGGFCHLSEAYGRLGLDAVLDPAIRYAEAGVPIAPRVAHDYAAKSATLNATARRFYLPWGKSPEVGAMLAMPGQAEVLRRIARDGAAGFYTGEVAEDIVASLKALGGPQSLADFAASAPTPTQPISGSYRGIDLVEHPPNGQGATAILLLNILSHFDIAAMDPWGAARAHIEAEATKLAYDARNRFVADADHMTRLAHMLAPETAAKLAALIDPKAVMAAPAPLTEAVHRDTIYITVVDRDRMAVSLIYSIFHGFGSGIASEKFGILLQNRGSGFSLTPGHPNEMAPGKRPMHTIIPGMLRENGRVVMPFGVMGGAYQSTGHARFVSNLRDFGLDPQAAIDAPRCFAEDGVLKLERGYSAETAQGLADLGHVVETSQDAIGGAQAILIRPDGVLVAGSDARKDGCAIGY